MTAYTPSPSSTCASSRNRQSPFTIRIREATGLGVPRKIIEGMRAYNGTEPDLVEEESRFVIRLWTRPASAQPQEALHS